MKKIMLILFMSFFATLLKAQNCDCGLYPIAKECKAKCGLKLLTTGTENQLIHDLKLKPTTAKDVLAIPDRNSIKTINAFKGVLSKNNFDEVQQKLTVWNQVNYNGTTNINNGSIINNIYYPKNDSITSRINQRATSTSLTSKSTKILKNIINGIDLSIKSCKGDLSNNRVTIEYSFVNHDSPLISIQASLNFPSPSLAIDTANNNYKKNTIITEPGTDRSVGYYHSKLPTQNTLIMSVVYLNVVPSATRFSYVELNFSGVMEGGARVKKNASFSNVLIEWQ